MSPSPDLLSPNTIHFNKDDHFTLGIKELLFLAFTLFIGFCGFTVCVDKIYAEHDIHHIENITVHTKAVTEISEVASNPLTLKTH